MVHKPGLAEHDFDHLPEASFPIATLPGFIDLHERVAGLVAPSKVVAVALNTSLYPRRRRGARRSIAAIAAETGLPADDPVRFGADRLWAAIRDGRRRAAVGRGDEPDRHATRSCTSPCATRSGSPAPTTTRATGVTTVVVELRDDRFPGIVGVGEGYPDRFYGETPETMAAVFPLLLDAVGELDADAAGPASAADPAMDGGDPLATARPSAPSTSPCTTSSARSSASRSTSCSACRPRSRRPTSRSASTSRRSSPSAPPARPTSRRSRSSAAGRRTSRRSGGPRASSTARSGSTPTPAGPATTPSALLPELDRPRRRADRAAVPGARLPRPRAGSRSARRCRSSPTRARSPIEDLDALVGVVGGRQRQARQVRRDRAGQGDARARARARLPDVPRLHGGDVGRDRRRRRPSRRSPTGSTSTAACCSPTTRSRASSWAPTTAGSCPPRPGLGLTAPARLNRFTLVPHGRSVNARSCG